MGVIIAAKNDFVSSEVPELQTECEIAWIKNEVAGCRPLYICGYYKPNEGDSNSLDQFEVSLRRLGIVTSHGRSAGGMNCPGYDLGNNCLKPSCNQPILTYQFVDLLDDLGLTKMVTSPTRGSNILDGVITNNSSIDTACRLINSVLTGVSDHDAIRKKSCTCI